MYECPRILGCNYWNMSPNYKDSHTSSRRHFDGESRRRQNLRAGPRHITPRMHGCNIIIFMEIGSWATNVSRHTTSNEARLWRSQHVCTEWPKDIAPVSVIDWAPPGNPFLDAGLHLQMVAVSKSIKYFPLICIAGWQKDFKVSTVAVSFNKYHLGSRP